MRKKSKFFLSLLIITQLILSLSVMPIAVQAEDSVYTELESPSEVYNMNIDWKYLKPSTTWPLADAMASAAQGDKPFYAVDYDDSAWETVSVPHQVNAADSFTRLGSNEGDTGQFRGIVFYRKHFTVPADAAGKKLFIEFEGMNNGAYVWINGQKLGYYEAAISPFGFDITDYAAPGEEAVIALANDSTSARGVDAWYRETKPGSEWGSNDGASFEWNTHEFTPTQAGLIYNVNMYVKSKVYSTLPLYNNLKTMGNYIYADNFDIDNKKARINVKAEIRNETAQDEDITVQVDVVKNETNEENDDVTPVLKYSFTANGKVTAATDANTADIKSRNETIVDSKAYPSEFSSVPDEEKEPERFK